MKYIKPQYVFDFGELNLLAANKRLGSYPFLKNNISKIKENYCKYHFNNGFPKTLKKINFTSKEIEAFENHYNSPPKGTLQFIDKTRNKKSKNICPMCGSLSNNTVDHFLPQKKYPEFSFYSMNLVPACSCNNKKNDSVYGVDDDDHFLHPYYNVCMSDKLLTVVFQGDLNCPKISVELLDKTHPDHKAIQFHFDNLIRPNGIYDHFDCMYEDMIENPKYYFCLEDGVNVSLVDLENLIKYEIKSHNNKLGTPNNWNSLFYEGFLKSTNHLNHVLQIINK